MKSRILLFIAIILVTLIVVFPALATGPLHKVSFGGPDACEGFGLRPGCNANLSLVAIEQADGSVIGQYTDQVGDGNGGFHAAIDCLSVSGNQAWASGMITRGSIGGVDLANVPVAVRVEDNGASVNDPADKISFSFIGDSRSCTQQIDYPMNDAPQGQVHVE